MGGLFSRFGAETYYANFDKAFEKNTKEKDRIEQRKQRRQTLKQLTTQRLLYLGLIFTSIACVYVAWVYKQPVDTYTYNGRILRISTILDVPLVMIFVQQVLLWCFAILEKWDERYLQKLQKSFDEMLKDLKDRNRYGKIMELLQKYDPEEKEKQLLLEKAKNEPTVVEPTPQKQSMARSKSIGVTLISGAGRLVDKLANGIIGDQPELVTELEELKSMLQSLERRNRELSEENRTLRKASTASEAPTENTES